MTGGPTGRESVGAPRLEAPPDRSSRYDVLHVERDTGVAAVTAASLSRYGLRTDPVRSGEAAIEWLGSGPTTRFDCIVSDYRPHLLDGIRLCQRVRQRFPDLPFLLFTGERGLEKRARAAGIDGVVRKTGRPEQFEALADHIRTTVSVRR